MLNWFKRFLFDETAFVGFVRAVLLAVGTAVVSGELPIGGLPQWVGIALIATGGFVRSSTVSRRGDGREKD